MYNIPLLLFPSILLSFFYSILYYIENIPSIIFSEISLLSFVSEEISLSSSLVLEFCIRVGISSLFLLQEEKENKIERNRIIAFFHFFSKRPSAGIHITSVLNRKNGSARRAELARKLRRRKAAESSFRDKVFIGFENLVRFSFHNSETILRLLYLQNFFVHQLLYEQLLYHQKFHKRFGNNLE